MVHFENLMVGKPWGNVSLGMVVVADSIIDFSSNMFVSRICFAPGGRRAVHQNVRQKKKSKKMNQA